MIINAPPERVVSVPCPLCLHELPVVVGFKPTDDAWEWDVEVIDGTAVDEHLHLHMEREVQDLPAL